MTTYLNTSSKNYEKFVELSKKMAEDFLKGHNLYDKDSVRTESDAQARDELLINPTLESGVTAYVDFENSINLEELYKTVMMSIVESVTSALNSFDAEEEFKENSKSIQIDSISISALLESKSYIDYLGEYYNEHDIAIRYPGGKFKDDRISKIVNYCEQLDIKTIDELVNKFKEEFPNYFNNWIKDKPNYYYTWNSTPLLEVLYDLNYSAR